MAYEMRISDWSSDVCSSDLKVAITAPPTRSVPSLVPVRAHSPEGLPAARIALWEELRMLRRRIATERGVPPYVILQDATLAALVAATPETMDDLRRIPGIGEAKLYAYGNNSLPAFSTHPP